jgi:hypothetical protein
VSDEPDGNHNPMIKINAHLQNVYLRPHKKNSWLASSPAHKKGPAQDLKIFFISKKPNLNQWRS